MREVLELLEAAEAKAMYGLAINWKPLPVLTEALLDRRVLQVGGTVGGGADSGARNVRNVWFGGGVH